MRKAVKEKLKAVLTSCLDLCPDGEIAVAISRTNLPDQYFTLSGDMNDKASAQEILQKVSEKL